MSFRSGFERVGSLYRGSLTAQQCDVRERIHCRLDAPRQPFELSALAAAASLDAALLRVIRIEDGAPPLPEGWIAVAFGTRARGRAGLLYLPFVLAHKWIDIGLHRVSSSNSDAPLSSFDTGVLLQILDMAMADWLRYGFPAIELRGVLDSNAQVAQYILPNIHCAWHVRAQLDFASVSDKVVNEVVLVGGDFAMELPRPMIMTNWDSAQQVPVLLRVVVGKCFVKKEAIQTLAPGDAIVLDELGVFNAGVQNCRFHLQSGYYAISAHWTDEQTFCVDEVFNMKNAQHTQPIEVRAPRDAALGLEVPLRVEVAELPMTVESVTRLVPGQVIRLNRPIPEEVVVRAAEQIICVGRLVQVDGELAVEVTEVR